MISNDQDEFNTGIDPDLSILTAVSQKVADDWMHRSRSDHSTSYQNLHGQRLRDFKVICPWMLNGPPTLALRDRHQWRFHAHNFLAFDKEPIKFLFSPNTNSPPSCFVQKTNI